MTHTLDAITIRIVAQGDITMGNRRDIPQYDLVIIDGRVIDPETELDAVRNVGINGSRIAKVTEEPIEGRETIYAEGLVVSPGFIDTHTHSAVFPHGVKLLLRDGVTSQMDLELGAREIDKWYVEREGKWQANYGTTVGHEFWRGFHLDGVPSRDFRDFSSFREQAAKGGVSNWQSHRSSLEELNVVFTSMDEGLRQGALGIGSTVGYAASAITAREMYETQRVAANYGRLTAVHARYTPGPPPYEYVISVQEILANAFALDSPLIVQHFNVEGWDLVHELLVRARTRGLNAWGEIYPYTAGSTTIGSEIFLSESFTRMGLSYEENLFDPVKGEYFTRESYEKTTKEDPGRIVFVFFRPKKWLTEWIKLPGVTCGSDSMAPIDEDGKELLWDSPYDKGCMHPRTAGAHAKWLRLGRENRVSLMQLIAQLSYTSAKNLGDTGLRAMQMRGRIQEGMVADITIFDFENVTDNSTYESGKGGLPSTGIPYVLVNGTVVVKDSEVLRDLKPGQAIRFPVEQEGRFRATSIRYGHGVN